MSAPNNPLTHAITSFLLVNKWHSVRTRIRQIVNPHIRICCLAENVYPARPYIVVIINIIISVVDAIIIFLVIVFAIITIRSLSPEHWNTNWEPANFSRILLYWKYRRAYLTTSAVWHMPINNNLYHPNLYYPEPSLSLSPLPLPAKMINYHLQLCMKTTTATTCENDKLPHPTL